MLAANDGRDQWLQHTGAAALASIGDTAALEALASHASKSVRSAAVVALRRLHHDGVARFLADADEGVATDAARAINDDGGIPGAIPQLAARLGAVKVTNEPLVRRALNANVRLGTPEAVARLEAARARHRDAIGTAHRGHLRAGCLGPAVTDGSRGWLLPHAGDRGRRAEPGRPSGVRWRKSRGCGCARHGSRRASGGAGGCRTGAPRRSRCRRPPPARLAPPRRRVRRSSGWWTRPRRRTRPTWT